MKDGRKRESPEVFVDQPITPIMNLIVSVLTMAEAFKEETEGRRWTLSKKEAKWDY